MRAAYLLFALALLSFADASYDGYRGLASLRGRRLRVVSRAEDPDQFRGVMTYQWIRGSLLLFAGFTVFGICRRLDRLDFVPHDPADSETVDDLNRPS